MREPQLDPATQAVSDLVQAISEKLVTDADQVIVLARRKNAHIVLQVMVVQEDFDRMQGANGRTAKALRCIAMAAARKHQLSCDVNVAAYASN